MIGERTIFIFPPPEREEAGVRGREACATRRRGPPTCCGFARFLPREVGEVGAMIGKLKGIIDSYGEDSVILNVNGVGYLVHCSARTLQELPRPGEPVTLSIETHVREDQIRLFGFSATSSANGSSCCRPCKASAPRWRSRCSARSSPPISPRQ